MNGRFSTLIVAVALVAVAVMAGAIVALWSRTPTVIAAQTTGNGRIITVVGHGKAQGIPDTAQIQLGVQSEAPTAREALSSNNSQMQALVAKLKELGVADKDLQTSNISIYPRYDNQGRKIEAYQVTNTLTVMIRNVSETGALLDQVVDAGANNMSGIVFLIDDPAALQQAARDAAIADARARAQAMAQAANATIGQVVSITENIGSEPPVIMQEAAMARAANDSVPVQTGEQTINAQVQITFELK